MAKTHKTTASRKKTRPKTSARKVAKSRKPAKAAKRVSAEDSLKELRRRLLEISDLNAAGAVLSWDQATYMPAGGATARGRQTAILSKLAHEKSIDPALGRLLDALDSYGTGLPHDSDDASLI